MNCPKSAGRLVEHFRLVSEIRIGVSSQLPFQRVIFLLLRQAAHVRWNDYWLWGFPSKGRHH